VSRPEVPLAAAAAARGDAAERDWTRIALRLVVATLAYNALEALVALASGVRAGSVVLVGFGLDSVIECAAAAVLLWRLRLEWRGVARARLESAEHRVHRFVGMTFFALAAYVVGQSGFTLVTRDAPAESVVGMLLAVASLVIMPLVAWGKLRAAREVGSAALRAEAKETLACSYLSFTLLAGLGANALWGWWWADPIAALAMVPWLLKEGREGLAGEACGDDCEAS
jgi:divalent metal cation (Fe/Co/Zn/Cd) transporter